MTARKKGPIVARDVGMRFFALKTSSTLVQDGQVSYGLMKRTMSDMKRIMHCFINVWKYTAEIVGDIWDMCLMMVQSQLTKDFASIQQP